jgi:hypothetical protein
MKVNYLLTLFKTSLLVPLYLTFPLCHALLATIAVIVVYPYIIAAIYGVKVMPTMDMACFFGDDTARANIMTAITSEKFTFE